MSPASAPPKHPKLLLISVMVVTIMFTMDTTIANIVLPQLQGSLQTSHDQLAWVITSYIVISAIFTPLLNPLCAKYGVSRVLKVSVIVFTVASVLCGLATSITDMVAYRMLQGASGASLVPLSQSVLLNKFPEEQHGRLISIWSVGVMAGPVLGPTLGGYLADMYNWRWVFLINLPVGIAAFIGIALTLDDSERRPAIGKFDKLGYLLLALFIGALQLFLDRGNGEDWFESTEIVIEAMVAVIGLYMFVVHSKTTANPFYTPAMFTDRNFIIGSILISVMLIGLYSTMSLMPLFLQQLQDYSVYQAGLLLAPRGLGMAVASIMVSRLIYRYEARYLVMAGIVSTILSLLIMGNFTLDVPRHLVISSGMLQGFGMGLVSVPLMTTAFATLPPSLRTEATVFFAVVRNLGSSIGVSIAITILARSSQTNRAILSEHLVGNDVRLWQLMDNLFGDRAAAILSAELDRQAAMIAYLNDFTLLLVLSVLSLPLTLLLQNRRSPNPA